MKHPVFNGNASVTQSPLLAQEKFSFCCFRLTILTGDPGMSKTETLNLRISADFKKRLVDEAAKERRSVTNYLEATLLAYWERKDGDGKEKGKKK
jgi:hypothetical protein